MSLFNRRALSTAPNLPLFSQLSDEMNRFWNNESIFNRGEFDLLGGWEPEIDIEKKNSMYLVRADIPGVSPKDIKVSMDDGNLIIEGKRDTKVVENKENFRCVERSYGEFYRSIPLPDVAKTKDIEAHCHNGVLEVSLPILATSKQKQIEVKVD